MAGARVEGSDGINVAALYKGRLKQHKREMYVLVEDYEETLGAESPFVSWDGLASV